MGGVLGRWSTRKGWWVRHGVQVWPFHHVCGLWTMNGGICLLALGYQSVNAVMMSCFFTFGGCTLAHICFT